MLDAVRRYDIAVGSRYLEGISVEGWPLHRIALSYSANAYARFITGLPLRDCTSGFCIYRRKVLEALALAAIKSEGYAFAVEMKYRAWAHGFTFSEVPILFWERRWGSSKISKRIIWEAAVMVWRLRLGL
jgi:dolichol-phosphate mannosyltransferase